MTIFVTGGAGFIGSEFLRQAVLRYPDAAIVNFDKLTYAGNLENLESIAGHRGYSFVKGDVCDAQSVAAAMPQGCDWVIHFAAESHVDRSILSAEEFIRTNVLGTQVMLDVARHHKVGRFLHISTDEVGGDLAPAGWFREDGPIVPSSPYAASKAAAEMLVHAARHTFGLNTLLTRTSNNYGPFQFPEKLLPLAISNAMSGTPIPVYGDGLQERDWIHVSDNCRALFAVLEKGKPGEAYHIGGGTPMANREVLNTLLRILDLPDTLLSQAQDRLGHDRRYAVDCSKIRQELGWEPVIPFEQGLRDTVSWYTANKDWIARCRSGEYQNYYARQYAPVLA